MSKLSNEVLNRSNLGSIWQAYTSNQLYYGAIHDFNQVYFGSALHTDKSHTDLLDFRHSSRYRSDYNSRSRTSRIYILGNIESLQARSKYYGSPL